MIKIITLQDRRIYSIPNQPTLVMKCQPLCVALFKQFRESHCNYCLKLSNTNRCSICKQYYYCSVACQKSDWQQHKKECQFINTINKELPCNLLLLIRCQLQNLDLQEFYGNIDKDSTQQLYQQYLDSAALLSKLMNTDNIQQLMQLQIKIQLNTFTITDQNGDSIGIGLYTPANYFNHRCLKTANNQKNIANCSHFFNQRELIVITNDSYTDTVQELCISYGNIMDYKKRQQYFKEQYGFTCDCDRCKEQTDQVDTLTPKIDEYMNLLQKQKFKSAFKILEEIIVEMQKYYDNKLHPYIGWKMNEASKLAFHLNYLLKAETYSIEAIKILEPYFTQKEEFKELCQRLNEIKAEIKMQK